MITARLEDVPLLSGYLHDAMFGDHCLDFNEEERLFRLKVTRICYEKPRRGKVLRFIPVTRFPWIDSWLTVSEVSGVEYDRRHGSPDTPERRHMLLSISERHHNIVELKAAWLRIRLDVAPSTVITIEDVPDSVSEHTLCELGKGCSRGMDEIDILRQRH